MKDRGPYVITVPSVESFPLVEPPVFGGWITGSAEGEITHRLDSFLVTVSVAHRQMLVCTLSHSCTNSSVISSEIVSFWVATPYSQDHSCMELIQKATLAFAKANMGMKGHVRT